MADELPQPPLGLRVDDCSAAQAEEFALPSAVPLRMHEEIVEQRHDEICRKEQEISGHEDGRGPGKFSAAGEGHHNEKSREP